MTSINPWINFNGNAFEAFTFYKSVFGGEFKIITRFKDIPNPTFKIPDTDGDKLMLISLPIGAHSELRGNDVPSFMGTVNENENRSKISVSTESKEEADKIFTGLSAGGEVEVPMNEGPWGVYFGMFRDKYGIEWVIEYAPSK